MDYSTLFLDPTRMQKQNIPAISPAFRQELAGVTPVKTQSSQPAPSVETPPVQKVPSKGKSTPALQGMPFINMENVSKENYEQYASPYDLAMQKNLNIEAYNDAIRAKQFKGSYDDFTAKRFPAIGALNQMGYVEPAGHAELVNQFRESGMDVHPVLLMKGNSPSMSFFGREAAPYTQRYAQTPQALKADMFEAHLMGRPDIAKRIADAEKIKAEADYHAALGQGVLGELPSKVESNLASAAYHRATAGKARAEAEYLPTKADALKLSKEIEAKKAQQVAYAKMLDDANKLEGDAREQAIKIANAYAEGKKLVKTKEAIPAEKGWFGFGKKPAIPAEYKEIPIRTEQDLDEEAKASGHSPAAIKAFKKKHGIQ